MIGRRLERTLVFAGVALHVAACGETPGAGSPPGEQPGDAPLGVVQLAITAADCTYLMNWPFETFTIKVLKYNAGAAGGVESSPTAIFTKNKNAIGGEPGGFCNPIASPASVITTFPLRPWRYQIQVEVAALVDGRQIKLNATNQVDVTVTSGTTAVAVVGITQAAPVAVGVDVTVTAWTTTTP